MSLPVYKCSFVKVLPFPKIIVNKSSDDFPTALIFFLEELTEDSFPYFPHFLGLHVLPPYSGNIHF